MNTLDILNELGIARIMVWRVGANELDIDDLFVRAEQPLKDVVACDTMTIREFVAGSRTHTLLMELETRIRADTYGDD